MKEEGWRGSDYGWIRDCQAAHRGPLPAHQDTSGWSSTKQSGKGTVLRVISGALLTKTATDSSCCDWHFDPN